MALILALVLGLYWVIRISGDKHETKKAREEFERVSNEEKLNRETWEAAVINRELEAELEDRLFNKDQELLDEVQRTWNDYFDYPIPEKYYVFKHDEKTRYALFFSREYYEDTTALRILMANRGFLLAHDAVLGIDFFAHGETELRRVSDYRVQEHFILSINEKLKLHGIDEEMYSARVYDPIYRFPSGIVHLSGTVKWEPQISSFDLETKLHSPSVK